MERFWIWLAWLLPKRLAYWCAVRVMSYGTTGNYSKEVTPNIKGIDALVRWNENS